MLLHISTEIDKAFSMKHTLCFHTLFICVKKAPANRCFLMIHIFLFESVLKTPYRNNANTVLTAIGIVTNSGQNHKE